MHFKYRLGHLDLPDVSSMLSIHIDLYPPLPLLSNKCIVCQLPISLVYILVAPRVAYWWISAIQIASSCRVWLSVVSTLHLTQLSTSYATYISRLEGVYE